MFTKVEILTGAVSVATLLLAFTLLQSDVQLSAVAGDSQTASLRSGLEVVSEDEKINTRITTTDMTMEEHFKIEDITIGDGDEVSLGDTVSVHYVGTLSNGLEFDSSKKRDTPLEFTVGAGQVIPGWEQGLLGMRVGGERTLVIPPELAYGDRGIGPIPGGATLLFTIELLEIK